jgi:hypothetical protein
LHLAVVIIDGLLSATALTLIVLPTLYVMFEGRGEQTVPVHSLEAFLPAADQTEQLQ